MERSMKDRQTVFLNKWEIGISHDCNKRKCGRFVAEILFVLCGGFRKWVVVSYIEKFFFHTSKNNTTVNIDDSRHHASTEDFKGFIRLM